MCHYSSKRKQIIVTGIEEFSCGKSRNYSFWNLIINWEFIFWLFIKRLPVRDIILSLLIMFWWKHMICVFLRLDFLLSLILLKYFERFLFFFNLIDWGYLLYFFIIMITHNLIVTFPTFSFLLLRFSLDLA